MSSPKADDTRKGSVSSTESVEKSIPATEEPSTEKQDGSEDETVELQDLDLDDSQTNCPRDVTLKISMDDVQPPPFHSESPPPYRPRGLRNSIRRAKAKSTGNVDFAKRVFIGLCCGTICFGVMVALNLAIPIAMIVMGALYLQSCPRQKYIPIYLLVGGCFGIAKAIINIVHQVVKNVKQKRLSNEGQEPSRRPNPADGIISCFLLAWFIAGCYWIYSVHGDFQSTDPTLHSYCNETLYLFAFWLTTVTYILLGLALLCCCALCIGMCVVAKSKS